LLQDVSTVVLPFLDRTADEAGAERCRYPFLPSVGCSELQQELFAKVATDSLVLGQWRKSGNNGGLAADAGALDVAGVVSLLQAQIQNVVMVYALQESWGARRRARAPLLDSVGFGDV
jgi:hypothetical protein